MYHEGDPRDAIGADIAGAAAGVLSMLAVHGLPERFPQYTESTLKSLVRILNLPARMSSSQAMVGGGSQSAPSSVAVATALEVAATQSAVALWALSSNPQCATWGSTLAKDESSLRVMLAAVLRGQRASTKARFHGSRLISSVTLAQLAAQGESYSLPRGVMTRGCTQIRLEPLS